MVSVTKAVSTRLPEDWLTEAKRLCPKMKVSEMISEAFAAWIDEQRRRNDDDIIARSFAAISSNQRNDERNLAGMAGRSALRIVERDNV